jgi:hypothetical protein
MQSIAIAIAIALNINQSFKRGMPVEIFSRYFSIEKADPVSISLWVEC